MRVLLGWIAMGTMVLAVCVSALAFFSTERRLERRFDLADAPLRVEVDEASRAAGQHIVRSVAQCTTCHGADLAGGVMADDWWLGRLDAPNLTPGQGGIASRSDADLEHAIRHGVDAEGRPMLLMPSQTLQVLSDGDVAAVISYLRSVPAVDREVRPRWIGPFTRLVVFFGAAPEFVPAEIIDHASVGQDIAPGATAEYGAYLVEIGACRVCHGEQLEGGLHPLSLPDEPPPPRLASGGALEDWEEADFLTAMRTGRTPDGRLLDERYMPWRVTAGMQERELLAIWRYLQSLEMSSPSVTTRSDLRGRTTTTHSPRDHDVDRAVRESASLAQSQID